ncbi:MAG: hypothetical protein Q7K98_04295 [Candidatus Omnitrophota bacterium]|nr:hypothetical protein [Candidatus Omnitrophota bacterium]
MISLIIEILLVSVSSYLFVARLFRTRIFTEFVLIWFLLFFGQIILVELSLGAIGKLYLSNVFFAHFLIFLIALLSFQPKQAVNAIKPDIELFFKYRLLLLALSVFICFFSVKTFVNLINPPISPESLQYHLAYPAVWIRSGSLDNPACIFNAMPIAFPKWRELSFASYYPINAELFFTWLMLPLRNAFLADIGEVPFYIIGIVAVYSILRKYNLKNSVALLSGFLWVLIPNIFKQLRTGSQIDVICATLFLLMIYTTLLLKGNFNFKYAALFSISTGIFLGTKATNIVWFIAALPFICYIFYKGLRTHRIRPVKCFLMFSSIAFIIILFGGFVYFKNFIFTGNPLFPAEVKVLGKTIFKGLLDNATLKTFLAYGNKFNLGKILFSEGLGAQFLGLILPGMFIPLIFYKQIRAKAKPLGEYLLLFMVPVMMIILYSAFINVNVYVVRYLFPFISMGLIAAVIFINLLPNGEKYFNFVAFISILASASELAHRQELIISIALSFILFAILLLFKKHFIAFNKGHIFNKFVLAFLILGILFLSYLNVKYDKEEYARYPLTFSKKEARQTDIAKGWQKLNEVTESGARVAYTGRMEFYPLFGTNLKNDVKYVSVNEKEATPYNEPDGLIRQIKDFPAWRENLKKEGIEYLFVALPFFDNRESEDPSKFPIEDEWASSNPQDFQLLFSNSLARIYKVSILDKGPLR